MNIIFSTLLAILIILLIAVLADYRDSFSVKRNEAFIEATTDKVSSAVIGHLDLTMCQYKAGPWHLVVYTQESDFPMWISNNNIRSIHPDAKNSKLIVKQFNGEDMVIENVENYELCAANQMCKYDL